MRLSLLFVFIIASFVSSAQTFLYKTELPEVDSDGYYHIFLPPEITSKLNNKFSDIRLYEKKNKEVPYLRLSEDEIFKTAKSSEIRIIENDYKKQKKYTYVLLHNYDKAAINNLVLIVKNPKNSEAWVNITGSNDLKTWNVLKNNSRYMPEYSDSTTAPIRIDDLPESNFEYYKILLYDFNKVVFEVEQVLNFDIAGKVVEFTDVSKPKFIQDDTTENNKTIVKIEFPEAEYIDKIKFSISSPDNYLRKADIVKKDSVSGKRIRLQLFDQNQKDFYLCSDSLNEIRLSRYFAKTLYLVVYNNDDSPLKFSNIEAYQQKEFLVAYLEKGKDYFLYFGNSNLPVPIYDLKFFKNKIPPYCQILEPKEIVVLGDTSKQNKTVEIAKVYLWIVFGVVVILLGLISAKLFIFSKKRNTENEEPIL